MKLACYLDEMKWAWYLDEMKWAWWKMSLARLLRTMKQVMVT
jgi:hypothetical protein